MVRLDFLLLIALGRMVLKVFWLLSIHNGFGLHHFKEELTGPGYAYRCIEMIKDKPEIETLVDTMVLEVLQDKTVIAVSPEHGLLKIAGRTVILTMGCRERTRGAIRIPGERPAGVFTAGAAQRMVNMEGYLPGHKIVIYHGEENEPGGL